MRISQLVSRHNIFLICCFSYFSIIFGGSSFELQTCLEPNSIYIWTNLLEYVTMVYKVGLQGSIIWALIFYYSAFIIFEHFNVVESLNGKQNKLYNHALFSRNLTCHVAIYPNYLAYLSVAQGMRPTRICRPKRIRRRMVLTSWFVHIASTDILYILAKN